jgi:hypothetical protein
VAAPARAGWIGSGLDALHARIAVHLLINGVDARDAELPSQCQAEAIGKGKRPLSRPKPERLLDGLRMIRGNPMVGQEVE